MYPKSESGDQSKPHWTYIGRKCDCIRQDDKVNAAVLWTILDLRERRWTSGPKWKWSRERQKERKRRNIGTRRQLNYWNWKGRYLDYSNVALKMIIQIYSDALNQYSYKYGNMQSTNGNNNFSYWLETFNLAGEKSTDKPVDPSVDIIFAFYYIRTSWIQLIFSWIKCVWSNPKCNLKYGIIYSYCVYCVTNW